MRLSPETVNLFNSLSEGVIVFDGAGQPVFSNQSAEKTLGSGLTDVSPQDWAERFGIFLPDCETLFPSAELPIAGALLGECLNDVELFVRNPNVPDGVWLSMSGQPLAIEDSTISGGGILIFREISKPTNAMSMTEKTLPDTHALASEKLSKKLIEQLEQKVKELNRFSSVVQASDYAIISISLEGVITSWNRGATKQFGFSPEETIGQSISMIFRPELRSFIPEWLQSVRRSESITFSDFAFVLKSGTTAPIAMTGFPVKDDAGVVTEAAFIGRDVTKERRQERQRATEINKHKDALASANHELTQLTLDLTTARDQAQAASALKSEFVANVSHEIRTPMNGVIGMCNALLKTTLTSKQRYCAQAIKDAGNALLTVINDILDFSKVEAGKLNIEIVDFDPISLVEGVCGLLVTQSRAKKLEMVLFIDPKLPKTLRGDPDRLRQILSNFISNAIKFSDHGQVVVRVEAHSEHDNNVNVLFSVSDSGIGISPEEQQRLFKPFVQADGSITRRFGGTGLGLSISKHLVNLMNGTLGVESEKGAGARFWFSVPLEARSKETSMSTREDFANARVLIVDDDAIALEILNSYLLAWGIRNDTATNAREAMTMLRQAHAEGDPYQIGLLDLVMPEENGFDLAHAVLADPVLCQTKLILVTAYDTPDLDKQAAEAGFKACLRKPVLQSHLFNCLLTLVPDAEVVAAKAPVATEGISRPTSEGIILVADDHPMNQQVAQMYLEELGLVSHIVSTGKEAVDAIAKTEYALVLMDCQMPEMDGFAATSIIRKEEALLGRKTPIIAMTANAMEGARERCIAAGMDDYICKPIDPDVLKKVIDHWLSLANAPSADAPFANADVAPIPVIQYIDEKALSAKFRPAAVAKLIQMYVSTTPETLDKIQAHVTAQDRAALSGTAHYLKGASGILFATEMAQLCRQLEADALTADWHNLNILAESLRRHFLALKNYLESKREEA